MRTITVLDGNLFKIAADYLYDPLQWQRIAVLNKLTTPLVDGLQTLLIPDIETARATLPTSPRSSI